MSRRGAWWPATIAATVSAATRILGRDDTNGYDESSARLKLHAQPSENLRADFTAMWVDLDNGYDAFAIDNSRTTLSDKPGQDTQIARALAVRLDYGGAESFDVVSRTAFGTSRSVYSFDGDWGNDASWGANAPYDYFQRFDRERRTLSEDLRLVSRGIVDSGADFAWLAGVYALRTDEDVQQHDVYHDLSVRRRRPRLSRAITAPPISPATASSSGGSGTPRCSRSARASSNAALTTSDTDGAAFSPDETMFGGSLSLRHALGERSTAYLTLARGYKAGGFNIGAAVPEDRRTFDTEVLHSLELGLRAANADANHWPVTSRSSICAARTSRCRPASSWYPGIP